MCRRLAHLWPPKWTYFRRLRQKLRHVDLLDSRVSDLSALAHLHGLRTLRFRGGQVPDLTPLAGLQKVQITIFYGGDVKTPTSLAGRIVRQ